MIPVKYWSHGEALRVSTIPPEIPPPPAPPSHFMRRQMDDVVTDDDAEDILPNDCSLRSNVQSTVRLIFPFPVN